MNFQGASAFSSFTVDLKKSPIVFASQLLVHLKTPFPSFPKSGQRSLHCTQKPGKRDHKCKSSKNTPLALCTL